MRGATRPRTIDTATSGTTLTRQSGTKMMTPTGTQPTKKEPPTSRTTNGTMTTRITMAKEKDLERKEKERRARSAASSRMAVQCAARGITALLIAHLDDQVHTKVARPTTKAASRSPKAKARARASTKARAKAKARATESRTRVTAKATDRTAKETITAETTAVVIITTTPNTLSPTCLRRSTTPLMRIRRPWTYQFPLRRL